MANLCNVFLITFGISFLSGQVSHGHELYRVSLNEGERQSCPNANCLGQVPCTTDDECSPYKCCIDLINSAACCYPPGGPTNEPATPPPATTPDDNLFPLCTDYFPQPPGECSGGTCDCEKQSDCYPNEICCIRTTPPPTRLLCYIQTAPTTTATQPPEGGKCPTASPPLECAAFQSTTCAAEDCRENEICCQVSRDKGPCCVVYP